MSVMAVLLALSCSARGPGATDPGENASPLFEVQNPAGEVIEGRFRDRRYGWELPIPDGWIAMSGPDAGLMRVSVQKVDADVRVEIWVFPGGVDLAAQRREGCIWTYQDEGHFTALDGDGLTHTATCVPDDPSRHRIYASIVRRGGQIVQVEVHAPVDALVSGKEAGDALTRGLVW